VCAMECARVDLDCSGHDFSGDLIVTLTDVPALGDGVQVQGWFDHGFGGPARTATGTIVDGRAELRVNEEWSFESFGAWLHLWIDDRRDGECGAGDNVSMTFISGNTMGATDRVARTTVAFGGPPSFFLSRPSPAFCAEFERANEFAGELADCEALCAPRDEHVCLSAESCRAFCSQRVMHAAPQVQQALD